MQEGKTNWKIPEEVHDVYQGILNCDTVCFSLMSFLLTPWNIYNPPCASSEVPIHSFQNLVFGAKYSVFPLVLGLELTETNQEQM